MTKTKKNVYFGISKMHSTHVNINRFKLTLNSSVFHEQKLLCQIWLNDRQFSRNNSVWWNKGNHLYFVMSKFHILSRYICTFSHLQTHLMFYSYKPFYQIWLKSCWKYWSYSIEIKKLHIFKVPYLTVVNPTPPLAIMFNKTYTVNFEPKCRAKSLMTGSTACSVQCFIRVPNCFDIKTAKLIWKIVKNKFM